LPRLFRSLSEGFTFLFLVGSHRHALILLLIEAERSAYTTTMTSYDSSLIRRSGRVHPPNGLVFGHSCQCQAAARGCEGPGMHRRDWGSWEAAGTKPSSGNSDACTNATAEAPSTRYASGAGRGAAGWSIERGEMKRWRVFAHHDDALMADWGCNVSPLPRWSSESTTPTFRPWNLPKLPARLRS
jgi:hypothetical protein